MTTGISHFAQQTGIRVNCLNFIVDIIETIRGCYKDEEYAKDIFRTKEYAFHKLGRPNANVDCFICNSNGCNGSAQYGPIALLIALPVVIARFNSR